MMTYRLLVFIFACFFVACQVPPEKIGLSFEKTELFSEQKASLQTEIFKGTTLKESGPSDFLYKSKRGKVEGTVYTAPREAGKDVITIIHLPSQTEKQVEIEILEGPRIVLTQSDQALPCNESLVFEPTVFKGGAKENLTWSDYLFQAEKGSFQGNRYQAPSFEAQDVVTVLYPPLSLQAKVSLQIKATPVLSLSLSQKNLTTSAKISVEPYFNKLGERLPADYSTLDFTAQRGKFSNNVYTAPSTPGGDQITVQDGASGQEVSVKITIERDVELIVNAPSKLISFEKRELDIQLKQGDSKTPLESKDLIIEASSGTMTGKTFQAPKDGTVNISVTHKKLNLKKQISLQVEYSQFRLIDTDNFQIEIPTPWNILATDMGFVASSSSLEDSYKPDQGGSEIKALVLSGFDFLDPKTIMVLFQQQGGMGKLEKVSEEAFDLSGKNATRITFRSSSGHERKSWWIILKDKGMVYLFTITGDESFFSGAEQLPQHVINSFQIKNRQEDTSSSLVMEEPERDVDVPFFSMKVPNDWKWGSLFGILFSSSKVSYEGNKMAFFILSYRSREMESIDPALILLLIRQEVVKDPSMQVTQERDIDFSGIQAKMLEFSGGEELGQKMWIIALKYNFTGYAIIFNGPGAIWDKNPSFAERILNTFSPK